MWPFKKKIKREEVVDAITDLQKQLKEKEHQLESIDGDRKDIFEQGKNEKDKQKQLYYAKKIKFIDIEKENLISESLLIMYNLNLANKLKSAIDSDQFYGNVSGTKLNKMLGNQKELGKFLNKAMNRRIKTEDMMTTADTIFTEVQNAYTPNEKIYGITEDDDQLLSIFEQEELHDIENSQLTDNQKVKIEEKVEK